MLEAYKLKDVLAEEEAALTARRAAMTAAGLDAAAAEDFTKNKFGIALSGGGIRSATINLGFLKTLNIFKLLQKADYLSTVSGGGYCGSYIQATLKERGSYDRLFSGEDIEHMRSYGAYLIPGQSARKKLWSTLVLAVGYLVSLLMSLLSPILFISAILISFRVFGEIFNFDGTVVSRFFEELLGADDENRSLWEKIFLSSAYGFSVVFIIHLLSNIILRFRVGMSRAFNQLESAFALIVFFLVAVMLVGEFQFSKPFEIDVYNAAFGIELKTARLLANITILFLLLLAGFILNPNALSFHRFYRTQLADAYLKRADNYNNIPIKNLFKPTSKRVQDWLNPYPIINTCLNLQSPGGGESFKGSKANDYFLLSPLYCGAKLVDYVKTYEFPGYKNMTLPAATTISAAAVNPGMGNYSNKVLSVFMTIFNARLGFWVNNPLKRFTQSNYIVWWPMYFFYELLSKINTNNRKLNISDGGHIENLGIYELLRRRCRLILAVDAGADPAGTFSDLNNLTIRARNELGIAIQFREQPEDMLTPRPSHGYAQKRFVAADMYQIWEEFEVLNESGNPYTYEEKNAETGEIKTKEITVLVNYSMDADEKVMPSIVLKIPDEHPGISERIREAANDSARRMVYKKLAESTETGKDILKVGTLIYVKSTVLAPSGKPFLAKDSAENKLLFDTYKYKIYHPDFPHEPTSDQFFDPVQWEAYYRLGQYMAAAVLGCKNSDMKKFMQYWDKDERDAEDAPPAFSLPDLIEWLDEGEKLPFDKKPLPELTDTESELKTRSIQPDLTEETGTDYTLEGKTYEEKATNEVGEPPVTPTPAPPPAIPDAAEEVDYEM